MTLLEAQRILDGEARRLLDEELRGESVDPSSLPDRDLSDGGSDQAATSLQGEPIPIGNAHRQSRVEAA